MSKKWSSFTPRHERPRDDPSSGGGRRPFPTNPTSTTSHLARRLASSSNLLKSFIPLPPSLRINGRRLTFTRYCKRSGQTHLPVSRFPYEQFFPIRKTRCGCRVSRSPWYGTGILWHYHPWFPAFCFQVHIFSKAMYAKDKCTPVPSIRALPPPTD